MKKINIKLLITVFAAVFVIFSVVIFIIAGFSGHNSIFWTSYGMAALAYIISAVVLGVNFTSKTFSDWLYGYPIVRWSVLYILAVTIAAIVCMFIPKVPWGVSFLIPFLLTVVYVILVVNSFIGKKVALRLDDETKKVTYNIRSLYVKINSLLRIADSAENRKLLEELSEMAKYSDPVSIECIKPIEKQLMNNIDEIQRILKNGGDPTKLIVESQSLLEERNQKIKAFK